MGQPAYPGVDDLVQLFAESNVTITNSKGLAKYVAAAQDEFESDTGRSPFLTKPGGSIRLFDPPGPNSRVSGIIGVRMGGGTYLMIESGYTSLTSLEIGKTPENGSGVMLTVNQDFWLDPSDARDASPPRPYTRIVFRHPVYGVPRSIAINATFGYCDELPSDAWLAVLQRAGQKSIEGLKQGASLALIEWEEAGVSERHSIELIQTLGQPWNVTYKDAIAKYAKLY